MIAKTWALALFESPTSPLPLHSARPRVDEGKHAVLALGGQARAGGVPCDRHTSAKPHLPLHSARPRVDEANAYLVASSCLWVATAFCCCCCSWLLVLLIACSGASQLVLLAVRVSGCEALGMSLVMCATRISEAKQVAPCHEYVDYNDIIIMETFSESHAKVLLTQHRSQTVMIESTKDPNDQRLPAHQGCKVLWPSSHTRLLLLHMRHRPGDIIFFQSALLMGLPACRRWKVASSSALGKAAHATAQGPHAARACCTHART